MTASDAEDDCVGGSGGGIGEEIIPFSREGGGVPLPKKVFGLTNFARFSAAEDLGGINGTGGAGDGFGATIMGSGAGGGAG